MKLWGYVFLISVLILIPIVSASEIRVNYFFHPLSPYSKEVEAEKNDVKKFWEGKVEWVEYDFTNLEQRKKFFEYDIASLPVAIVECFEEKIKIERSEAFADVLNKTIYYCYKKTEEKDLRGIILTSVFLACILISLNLKKQICKKLKMLKIKIRLPNY